MRISNQIASARYKIIIMSLALFLVFNVSVCCNIYGDCTKEVKGIIKNEVISDGNVQVILKEGVAINTTINKGGMQMVFSGGVAKGSIRYLRLLLSLILFPHLPPL
jgi:autotransporter passenger strand-loop-strand repeat protein